MSVRERAVVKLNTTRHWHVCGGLVPCRHDNRFCDGRCINTTTAHSTDWWNFGCRALSSVLATHTYHELMCSIPTSRVTSLVWRPCTSCRPWYLVTSNLYIHFSFTNRRLLCTRRPCNHYIMRSYRVPLEQKTSYLPLWSWTSRNIGTSSSCDVTSANLSSETNDTSVAGTYGFQSSSTSERIFEQGVSESNGTSYRQGQGSQ